MLKDDDRVGVLERGGEHAASVRQRGRRDDPDPGNVGIPRLEAVRMLRRELPSCARRHPDDERHVALAAGHVQQRCGVVEDLVQREQAEVDRHDLDDGPHSAERCPDACSSKSVLRQRRIANAVGAELLQQSEADTVRTAIRADVLTHQKDPLVVQQCLADRSTHGLAVRRPGRCLGRLGWGCLGGHVGLRSL